MRRALGGCGWCGRERPSEADENAAERQRTRSEMRQGIVDPKEAMPIPMMAPTVACVVETGIWK